MLLNDKRYLFYSLLYFITHYLLRLGQHIVLQYLNTALSWYAYCFGPPIPQYYQYYQYFQTSWWGCCSLLFFQWSSTPPGQECSSIFMNLICQTLCNYLNISKRFVHILLFHRWMCVWCITYTLLQTYVYNLIPALMLICLNIWEKTCITKPHFWSHCTF